MKYEEILNYISIKENVSKEEIEKEMQIAIKSAGLDCSPKDFIEIMTRLVKKDYKS